MQLAAEVHVVSHIAEGEAPEWGCDAPFTGGEPNFANCTSAHFATRPSLSFSNACSTVLRCQACVKCCTSMTSSSCATVHVYHSRSHMQL